jgi:hypothetical protein
MADTTVVRCSTCGANNRVPQAAVRDKLERAVVRRRLPGRWLYAMLYVSFA